MSLTTVKRGKRPSLTDLFLLLLCSTGSLQVPTSGASHERQGRHSSSLQCSNYSRNSPLMPKHIPPVGELFFPLIHCLALMNCCFRWTSRTHSTPLERNFAQQFDFMIVRVHFMYQRSNQADHSLLSSSTFPRYAQGRIHDLSIHHSSNIHHRVVRTRTSLIGKHLTTSQSSLCLVDWSENGPVE